MTKILLTILVALLVYGVLRSYNRTAERRETTRPQPTSSGSGEDMVRCAHCGVYLPRSESLMTQSKFYCTEEHRRLHA